MLELRLSILQFLLTHLCLSDAQHGTFISRVQHKCLSIRSDCGIGLAVLQCARALLHQRPELGSVVALADICTFWGKGACAVEEHDRFIESLLI